MKHKDYKHLAEHEFGLDTQGMFNDELQPYHNEISEMAQRYDVSYFYIQRTVTYLTCKNFRKGKNSDLEKSIETIGRWLRIRGEE